jgi:hypothetical protein
MRTAKHTWAISCFFAVFLSGCLPPVAQPGKWLRLNDSTLYFRGSIDSGSDKEFLALVDARITQIRVSTFGGDVEPALVIAEFLHDHNIDLEVEGVCVSSCANYWFPAANRKIVPVGSYVGFHGDITSSIPYWHNPSAETIASAEKTSAKEQAFYQKIGLNPKLFQFSIDFIETNDVGIWAISPKEAACAGVKNLEMWFPSASKQFTLADSSPYPTVGISLNDKRVPTLDLCQIIEKPYGRSNLQRFK